MLAIIDFGNLSYCFRIYLYLYISLYNNHHLFVYTNNYSIFALFNLINLIFLTNLFKYCKFWYQKLNSIY